MSPLAACLALALACCSANAETIEDSHQPAQREAAVARREAAVAQREAAVAEREAAMAEQLLRGRLLQWGWAALPGLGGGPNAPPSPPAAPVPPASPPLPQWPPSAPPRPDSILDQTVPDFLKTTFTFIGVWGEILEYEEEVLIAWASFQNVIFVCLVAYFLYKMPANAVLIGSVVVAVSTSGGRTPDYSSISPRNLLLTRPISGQALVVILGPNVVGLFLWVFGTMIDVSIKFPIYVIVFLYVVKLFSSTLFQRCLVCLGLDADDDGDVDVLDVVGAIGQTSCGKALRMDRLHSYLHNDLKLFRRPDPKRVMKKVQEVGKIAAAVHQIVSDTNKITSDTNRLHKSELLIKQGSSWHSLQELGSTRPAAPRPPAVRRAAPNPAPSPAPEPAPASLTKAGSTPRTAPRRPTLPLPRRDSKDAGQKSPDCNPVGAPPFWPPPLEQGGKELF
jgi:hypothetical protein